MNRLSSRSYLFILVAGATAAVSLPRAAIAATSGTNVGCAVPDQAATGPMLRTASGGAPAATSPAPLAAGLCEPARLMTQQHPLAIVAMQYDVAAGKPLTVRLTTASFARIAVTLRVHDKRGMVLYRTSLVGLADAQGRFAGTLRIAYIPSCPTSAQLTVSVGTPLASAVHSAAVTLLH